LALLYLPPAGARARARAQLAPRRGDGRCLLCGLWSPGWPCPARPSSSWQGGQAARRLGVLPGGSKLGGHGRATAHPARSGADQLSAPAARLQPLTIKAP